MSLSKKYDIPQDKIQNLIKDGWISCSAPMYEKIYQDFQASMSVGNKTKTAIIYEVASRNNVDEKTVRNVILKFKE